MTTTIGRIIIMMMMISRKRNNDKVLLKNEKRKSEKVSKLKTLDYLFEFSVLLFCCDIVDENLSQYLGNFSTRSGNF